MKLVPTDDKSFARDIGSGALVNTDNEALEMHKARRKALLEQSKAFERLNQVESDVTEIRTTLDRVLSLLEQLNK